MIEKLPLAQVGAYEPEALATFYRALHDSGQRTFHDRATGMYVVWRHADVQQVLSGKDPDVGNENSLDPLTKSTEFALTTETLGGFFTLKHLVRPATANASDPDHAAVKDAVFDAENRCSLNRRHTEKNHGDIVQQVVDVAANNLQREFEQNDIVDLNEAYISPIASHVIGSIIGFSVQDQDKIREWSEGQTALLGQRLERSRQGPAVHALANLAVECYNLVKDRKRNPKKDLASLLMADQHELSFKLAGSAAMNLIAAGYATTHNTIGNSMRFLSSQDGQEYWHNVAEPSFATALMPELIRVETGLVGWKRRAKHAITLGDGATKIPRGKTILALLGAANRDPEAFPNPDRIKDRPTHPAPVSFGIGPHLCMGKELAVLEIREALTTLRKRFPNLQVVESGGIQYEPDYLFRAPRALPVRLG